MRVSLQNRFLCNLRCFVAKPVLSRFMHFLYGDKLRPKFCAWRKITYIIYEYVIISLVVLEPSQQFLNAVSWSGGTMSGLGLVPSRHRLLV